MKKTPPKVTASAIRDKRCIKNHFSQWKRRKWYKTNKEGMGTNNLRKEKSCFDTLKNDQVFNCFQHNERLVKCFSFIFLHFFFFFFFGLIYGYFNEISIFLYCPYWKKSSDLKLVWSSYRFFFVTDFGGTHRILRGHW